MSAPKREAYSPESDTVNEYIRWKRARQETINQVSLQMLSLDDPQIASLLESREKVARDLLKTNSSNAKIIVGLFHLSIVIHFSRALAHLVDLVPRICQLVQSGNRCICCASTRVLSQFCRSSVDGVNFFHDILRTVQHWAVADAADSNRFSSLCILKKAYHFAPALVRSVVVPRFDTLFHLALSNDPAIQDYAVCVLKQHIPAHKTGYTSHMVSECISLILPKKSPALRGALLILEGALQNQFVTSPKILRDIVQRLLSLKNCNNKELMTLAYQVLRKVMQVDQLELDAEFLDAVIENLGSSLKAFGDCETMVQSVKDVLVLIPKQILPIEGIVKLAHVVFSASKVSDDLGYWLLNLVVDKSANYVMKAQVPLDYSLSKSYRELFRKWPVLIVSGQNALLKHIEQSLKPNVPEPMLIKALKLIRVCGTFATDKIKNLKERVMELVVSKSAPVRAEAIKILSCLDSENKNILFSALFDESEKIRITAVKCLVTSSSVVNADMISMVLADESVEVRSKAIDLFQVIYDMNPMAIMPSFYKFTQELMQQYSRTEDLGEAQALSKLFPKTAELCQKMYQDLSCVIGTYCLYFLTRGTIPRPPIVREDNRILIDPFNKRKESMKAHIFYLYFSPCLDVCDVNFIRTVEKLRNHVNGDHVIAMAKVQLSHKKSEEAQIALLDLITSMVGMIDREKIQEVAGLLFDRFIVGKSYDVYLRLLRLFGKAGLVMTRKLEYEESSEMTENVTVSTNRFVTHEIFSAICNLIPNPPPAFFQAAMSVLVLNAARAPSFMGKIIPEFIRVLSISKGDFANQLVAHLMKIVRAVRSSFTPYVELLAPILEERLGEVQCLKFLILLSRTLFDNMIPVISKLYHSAVGMMTTHETRVAKHLLRFIASAVIFQNQSIDTFLGVCEQHATDIPQFVNRELIRVLQNYRDAGRCCTRILRIVLKMMPHSVQALYSVVLYGGVSWGIVNAALGDGYKDPNMLALKQYVSGDKSVDLDFVVRIPAVKNLMIQDDDQEITVTNVFRNFAPPVNNNVDKWFHDFVYLSVSMSPNPSVRNCIGLVNQSEQFRQDILIPAFITCWNAADNRERQQFLSIFTFVLETFRPLPTCIFRLIDALDVQKCEFHIPKNVLATAASASPSLAYFYWTRHFCETGKDANLYLEHCLEMGRIDTAKGILASIGKDSLSNIDYWNERLGNWKKTLKMCREDEYARRIKAYGHLEEWQKISSLFNHFSEMSQKDQEETSIWFALSFYYSNKMDLVNEMLSHFPDHETRQHIFMRLLVLITNNDFEKAEAIIRREFARIASHKTSFDGSAITEDRLHYAQHLIEFEEVIEMKKNESTKVPSIWSYRGRFVDRTRDCRELAKIRSLVLPDDEKLKLNLEMAIALRKGREIKSFSGIYSRLIALSDTPDVRLEGIMMLWARNLKKAAIAYLAVAVNCFIDYNPDFIRKKLSELSLRELKLACFVEPTEDKSVLIERFVERLKDYAPKAHEIPKQAARCLRLLTEWTMPQGATTRESLKENMERLELAMQLKPNDAKILFDYALFTEKALELDPSDEFALHAIRSFVKVIQVTGDNVSIAPLLQLLNIIARYANETILGDPVFDDIRKFPQAVIAMAMPQFENLISHQCAKLRHFIASVLVRFGKSCFQSLFYSLNLAMQGSDAAGAKIATSVYEKLAETDPELANEMQLFIQGLRKSAISLLEQWKSAIENARKEFESGNEPGMVSILTNILYIHDHPSSELDRTFRKLLEKPIEEFRDVFKKFCKGERKIQVMWNRLRSVFEMLTNKLAQFAVINLHYACEPLALKRHFRVVIPGNEKGVCIESICPVMKVFNTAFHPRFVSLVGSDGKNYNFLLKGSCDVRVDFRIMQFFKLANSLLSRNKLTHDLTIIEYSIIPFAPDAGVISWVENADSLHEIITEFKEERAIESQTIVNYCGHGPSGLNCLQLYELHEQIRENTNAMEIARYLWLKTRNATIWLRNSDRYAKSLALMSMCGYIIGLGDRHPNNMLIQKHSGAIAHIDFGDSFEVTMNRVVYPERVPFRLTRMLVNALDGCTPYGLFEKTCQNVMSILRKSKQSVTAQLELCARDPALVNLGFDRLPIVERVREKLDGADHKLFDTSEQLDIDEHVNRLIEIASDKLRYSMQFIGWCPHW